MGTDSIAMETIGWKIYIINGVWDVFEFVVIALSISLSFKKKKGKIRFK
jgi:hypothetical protein